MQNGFHSVDSDGNIRWRAPQPPDVGTVDLQVHPKILRTELNRNLRKRIRIATRTMKFRTAGPRSISVPIVTPRVDIRSFAFAEPTAVDPLQEKQPPPSGSTSPRLAVSVEGSATRIRPPSDVIKLEDRLEYLLQPSLESLLAERSMQFPFQPFPYQYEGIAFLYPRHAAILADEMGLGKTMQAITAIRLLLRCAEIENVLLICPKPLVTNWQREFELWAPEVPIMVVEGDQAKRTWQWRLPDVPVRIANYELLLRDRELLETGNSGQADGGNPPYFDLTVLDESQRIKNQSSTTSQVVRAISRGRSWALTGTPVENSAEDLVGIFEFLAPGFLSPDMKPRKMGRTISDYVLRRVKDQVLTDLPPKLFRDADMDLSAEQQESYHLAEDEGIVRLSELGDSACIQHVFELILRLKQICNFDPVTGASAKLERLEADLEEIARSGRKAIVFSQWVGTLRRLADKLQRFGPLEYHGKIPTRKRDAIIERFRNDPDKHLILMSYGAGGVGLNLQFAHYVFLFDRWWNPAVEDQAINRAHRIGVAGPVTVTRFLMLQTIEERINLVLQEKRELFDTIFSGTESGRKMGLTGKELFGLFKLKCPGATIDVAA